MELKQTPPESIGEDSSKRPRDGDGARAVDALPTLVARIQAPAAFSPSHLAQADSCLLRAVLASQRVILPLQSHPAARIGTAFHLLLERAVKGDIERVGTAELDAQRELQSILADENSRWVISADDTMLDLKRVWPPIIWRQKVRLAIDQAVRHMSNTTDRRKNRHDGASVAPIDFESLPPFGTFAEVRMRAPELRLIGKADVIQKSSDCVTIRDLKTGRVVADDGSIRAHISRQLQLYGLMACEASISVAVRLIVDDGGEREVPFTTDDAKTLREWLRDLLDRVPAGEEIDANQLASFGAACLRCGFRYACPAYHRDAPDAWKVGASHRLPLDIWGTVEAAEMESGGMARLQLRDVAGRQVVISGLNAERLNDVVAGDFLYFFGLQTRDRIGGSETARHPLNFFEESPDAPYARAWTLAVFCQRA